MAIDNGIASIGICAFLCACTAFLLYKKTHTVKTIVYTIIFFVGFYIWFTDYFFKLPLTLSWWRENTLQECTSWTDGISLVPFSDIAEAYDRFGFYGCIRVAISILKNKSGIILGSMLMAVSLKDVILKIKKGSHVLYFALAIAVFPFMLHASFVIFGGSCAV